LVKLLIEHGANINKKSNNGQTPLFYACHKGHENIVKYLVEKGADINKESNDGCTPLYNSYQEKHENTVKYLVEHNVDLNKEGNWTPLLYACQEGHEDIIKGLINKNKEKIVTLYNKYHKHNIKKGLIYKIQDQNIPKSERLQMIIEICVPFMNASSSLIKRLMKDNKEEILEILFKKYLKFFDYFFIIDFLNYYKNKTPISDSELYAKINNDKYKISTELNELNENIDQYSSSYYLHNACKSRNKASVKFLLEHGADIK